MLFFRCAAAALLPAFTYAKLKPYDFDQTYFPTIAPQVSLLPVNDGEDPFKGVKFESGYIPVGKQNGGEMFFWYFEKTKGETDEHTPIIIWLTGGPGCSSAMAALTENGPLTLDEDTATAQLNPWGWTGLGEVVFIDQPLGTGFSTVGDPRNLVRDEDTVAADLREFLEGFLAKFPKAKNRPVYITGESYAGHYVPAIASRLVEAPITDLDFRGMAIGNGWVDPVAQYPMYAEFAKENGLVGPVAYRLVKKGFELCTKLIDKHLWELAYLQCNALADGILGKRNPYDIRQNCDSPPMCYNTTGLDQFLNEPEIQRRLGVKKQWDECSSLVYAAMLGDWCTDMTERVAKVLAAGKQVLVYSGDKDYICNWRGGLEWTLNVPWKYRSQFASSRYTIWDYEGKHRGELKQAYNLAFLRVYEAGHMVPMDQPEAAYGMLEQWINQTIAPPADGNQKWQPESTSLLNDNIGFLADALMVSQ